MPPMRDHQPASPSRAQPPSRDAVPPVRRQSRQSRDPRLVGGPGTGRAPAAGARAPVGRDAPSLLQMQRTLGNRHVQRLVAAQRPEPATGNTLEVGPPNDRFEREADQVAQRVAGGAPRAAVHGTGSSGTAQAPGIQRLDGAGGGPVAPGLARAIEQAHGGSQAIPDHVRGPLEQAMGADFSGVRVHTDARADRLNRQLGARAFTSGPDVFLERGTPALDSGAGRRVLAHELTHVLQQGHGAAAAGPPAAAGAPGIQLVNKFLVTHHNPVEHPIWTLHRNLAKYYDPDYDPDFDPENGADYGGDFGSDFYSFPKNDLNKEHHYPLKPGKKLEYDVGGTAWRRANRPEYVVAELDGVRPKGKRGATTPPQTFYGYLGQVERALLGREFRSGLYEGGHLVADQILGPDSYTNYNFAPQQKRLNAPVWRVFEELAEQGPVPDTGAAGAGAVTTTTAEPTVWETTPPRRTSRVLKVITDFLAAVAKLEVMPKDLPADMLADPRLLLSAPEIVRVLRRGTLSLDDLFSLLSREHGAPGVVELLREHTTGWTGRSPGHGAPVDASAAVYTPLFDLLLEYPPGISSKAYDLLDAVAPAGPTGTPRQDDPTGHGPRMEKLARALRDPEIGALLVHPRVAREMVKLIREEPGASPELQDFLTQAEFTPALLMDPDVAEFLRSPEVFGRVAQVLRAFPRRSKHATTLLESRTGTFQAVAQDPEVAELLSHETVQDDVADLLLAYPRLAAALASGGQASLPLPLPKSIYQKLLQLGTSFPAMSAQNVELLTGIQAPDFVDDVMTETGFDLDFLSDPEMLLKIVEDPDLPPEKLLGEDFFVDALTDSRIQGDVFPYLGLARQLIDDPAGRAFLQNPRVHQRIVTALLAMPYSRERTTALLLQDPRVLAGVANALMHNAEVLTKVAGRLFGQALPQVATNDEYVRLLLLNPDAVDALVGDPGLAPLLRNPARARLLLNPQLAPLLLRGNARLPRLGFDPITELGRASPHLDQAQKPVWHYTVSLHYPPAYHVTVGQLEESGIIEDWVANNYYEANGTVDDSIRFERRVPDRWEATLTAPNGYIFPRTGINPDNVQADFYVGTASEVATNLGRHGSGYLGAGIESLHVAPVAPANNLVRAYGGNRVERFASVQYYPQSPSEQPHGKYKGPQAKPVYGALTVLDSLPYALPPFAKKSKNQQNEDDEFDPDAPEKKGRGRKKKNEPSTDSGGDTPRASTTTKDVKKTASGGGRTVASKKTGTHDSGGTYGAAKKRGLEKDESSRFGSEPDHKKKKKDKKKRSYSSSSESLNESKGSYSYSSGSESVHTTKRKEAEKSHRYDYDSDRDSEYTRKKADDKEKKKKNYRYDSDSDRETRYTRTKAKEKEKEKEKSHRYDSDTDHKSKHNKDKNKDVRSKKKDVKKKDVKSKSKDVKSKKKDTKDKSTNVDRSKRKRSRSPSDRNNRRYTRT